MRNNSFVTFFSFFLFAALILQSPLFPEGLVIDKKRKEVRLPFQFSEHSRVIEVFGCSPGGPTHETVIVFKANGSALADALKAVGARPESFWQVGHPQDFMHTQGDRILVLLKWEHHGHTHETAAERLLWRTGEDLPQPVLGFSFKAKKVKHGTPPETKVPDCVELTMGGMGRQSSVSSLLVHPTAFPFYMHHVSNIELNPAYAREIQHMAHQQKGGTLILRLVNESGLCRFKQNQNPPMHWGYETVYKKQQKTAEKLDALKASFVGVRTELNSLLRENNQEKKSNVKELLAEAEKLSWEIQKAYIDLYTPQWMFQRKLLQNRLKSFEKKWRFGYDYLMRYTPERLRLAELTLRKQKKQGDAEKLDLQIERSRARLWELKKSRFIPLMREEIEELTLRIRDEKKEKNTYLVKLLENDLLKETIKLRRAETETRLWKLKQRELEGKLNNTASEGVMNKLKTMRKKLEKKCAMLDIEEKIAELNDEIRWAEDASHSSNPEEQKKAEETLKELRAEKAGLEDRLKRAQDG